MLAFDFAQLCRRAAAVCLMFGRRLGPVRQASRIRFSPAATCQQSENLMAVTRRRTRARFAISPGSIRCSTLSWIRLTWRRSRGPRVAAASRPRRQRCRSLRSPRGRAELSEPANRASRSRLRSIRPSRTRRSVLERRRFGEHPMNIQTNHPHDCLPWFGHDGSRRATRHLQIRAHGLTGSRGRVPGRGVRVGRPGAPWVGPLWFMRPQRAA